MSDGGTRQGSRKSMSRLCAGADMSNPSGRSISLTMIKALVLVMAGATLMLSLRSIPALCDVPLTEDGYYMLSVSRNMGLGKGMTIDGHTPTNGVQPLWTLLCAPLFFLVDGDRILGLRLVLAAHWMVFLATAYCVGRIAQGSIKKREIDSSLAFWVAALVYLSSVGLIKRHFNGLETGFTLFLYALAWRYYQLGRAQTWRGLVAFGGLLGLLVLARIDAVFLVIIIALYQLVSPGGDGLIKRLARGATVGAVSFLVSSPWWFYNLKVFGALIPSSGAAQQAWGLSWARIAGALIALSNTAVSQLYMATRFETTLAVNIARTALAGVIVLLFWKAALISDQKGEADRGKGEAAVRRTLEFGALIFMATGVLVGWYVASSWATHFYSRYFSPFALVWTVAISYILAVYAKRLPRLTASLLILLALTVIFGVYGLVFQKFVSGNQWYREQLSLVRSHIPDDEPVAAGQSGTLGYFRDEVLNLDGKVNAEALEYQDRMDEYLTGRGVVWFCDWPSYFRQYFGEGLQEKGWRVVGQKGRFQLYRRESDH